MNTTLYKVLYTIPVIGASISIYYISSLSQIPFLHHSFEWYDKVLHCGAYIIYGCTLLIALHPWKFISINKKLGIFIVLGLMYGASDEYHQSFVAGRSSEIADWIADVMGICIASIFIVWNKKKG